MLIAPSSYGALSTTSANTIQGKAPTFTGQSGANKLGFKVGDTLYSEAEGNIESNTIKEFDGGLKLDDFDIKTLDINDFNPLTDYLDEDGDEAHPTRPLTAKSYGYEWRDGNNNIIRDYTQTIGCGSGLSLPLKLIIDLNGVQVYSKYGNPSASKSTTLTKTYQIGAASGICFAAPSSLNVYSSSGSGKTGGGYNSKDFVPNKGFKANPISSTTKFPSKFPTTGYPDARFQLVMTGSQTDYTYEVEATPVGSVEVDTDGWVTLKSKPRGTVTVTAKLKRDPRITHDYSFSPTKLWVTKVKRFKTIGQGYPQVESYCGGWAKVPVRKDITNGWSNSSIMPEFNSNNSAKRRTATTRAISGQLIPEWDFGSSYGWNFIWTRDRDSSYYYIILRGGVIFKSLWSNDGGYAVCIERG
ncbi:hypothetical protein RCS94_04730 [Orbaceae bacterium ac157xtp]